MSAELDCPGCGQRFTQEAHDFPRCCTQLLKRLRLLTDSWMDDGGGQTWEYEVDPNGVVHLTGSQGGLIMMHQRTFEELRTEGDPAGGVT